MGSGPRDCGPSGQQLGFIFTWWRVITSGELSDN